MSDGTKRATLSSFAARSKAEPKLSADFHVGRVDGNAPAHIIGFERFANSQEIRKNLAQHGHTHPRFPEQPPITHRDFEQLPEIVATGRYQILGETGRRKPQRIEYRAGIDGKEYVYTETVGIDRRRVALQSFYRKS